MRRASTRDHGASILVAALSSAFGVLLLQVTGILSTELLADPAVGGHSSAAVMLYIIAFVFLAIAVYVGAIVTANTFSTIIAGRTRTIALLRLIGSSAAAQRRSVATEGLVVGLIGSAAGAVVGTGVAAAIAGIGVASGLLPALGYGFFSPVLLAPVVIVVLTTWLASWVGSRRVLRVTPLQAMGASQELSQEEARGRRARNATAIVLFAAGIALLVLGVLVGLITPLGVLIGLVGGILSFTGLVQGAGLVMPPALRLTGRLFGGSAESRLAAANAVRYPERSSRTTIGLVIGVTLITMFAVAMQGYQDMIQRAEAAQPEVYQGVDESLNITVAIFSVLIGFSALIAAVGMVNNLSLSVLQRRRELGLLRALGFTAAQVRRMIVAEAAQLTIASLVVGLVLGTFYGWAGAQSLLASMPGGGFVVPHLPWQLLVGVVLAAVLLTVAASVAPSRRATRVAPVVALAVE